MVVNVEAQGPAQVDRLRHLDSSLNIYCQVFMIAYLLVPSALTVADVLSLS